MAEVFSFLTAWLAPITCFTAEEAWLARPRDMPDGKAESVHLRLYPTIPEHWLDAALGEKWKTVRALRRVVTGALELERAEKRIGSSLQAAPHVHAAPDYMEAHEGSRPRRDLHHLGRRPDRGRGAGRRLHPARRRRRRRRAGPAEGEKCARCWQVLEEVGKSAAHPLICQRCEGAVTSA